MYALYGKLYDTHIVYNISYIICHTGIAMTLGSLAKALGPIISSLTFAYTINHNYPPPFNYMFIFILLMGFTGINCILFMSVYRRVIAMEGSSI